MQMAAKLLRKQAHGAHPPPNTALQPSPLPPRQSNRSGTSPKQARQQAPSRRLKMGRMVSDGALTRDTLVWTAGQDGWIKAADVAALATLLHSSAAPSTGGHDASARHHSRERATIHPFLPVLWRTQHPSNSA